MLGVNAIEIIKIKFWYNSLYAFECFVDFDLLAEQVIYITNMDTGLFADYNFIALIFKKLMYSKSFFLIDNNSSIEFGKYAERALLWQAYYGTGYCIDGQYWELITQMENGKSHKSRGENGKPNDFGEFVEKFELLLKKPIEKEAYKSKFIA